MSAQSILEQLQDMGFTVTLDDGGRLLCSPASKLSDELRQTIRSQKAEIMTLLQVEPEPPFADNPDWLSLATCELTDMAVDDLDQAQFLFAVRLVQKTERSGLPAMWERYSRYWRERLPIESFKLVQQEYTRHKNTDETPVDVGRQVAMISE